MHVGVGEKVVSFRKILGESYSSLIVANEGGLSNLSKVAKRKDHDKHQTS